MQSEALTKLFQKRKKSGIIPNAKEIKKTIYGLDSAVGSA